MVDKKYFWGKTSKSTITKTKLALGNLAISVRKRQFYFFLKLINPSKNSKTLDVGVSSEEDIHGTNLFEKMYKYKEKLVVATIEDTNKIKKKYPASEVVKVKPNRSLPFKDYQFDILTSWATLEHVGSYKKQEFFINELLRVGKKVFITTPYRGCIYEPHSGILLFHWLPLRYFRKICLLLNKNIWSDENILNPLWINDIKKMNLKGTINIKIFKMFGFLPSHIIIYRN